MWFCRGLSLDPDGVFIFEDQLCARRLCFVCCTTKGSKKRPQIFFELLEEIELKHVVVVFVFWYEFDV